MAGACITRSKVLRTIALICLELKRNPSNDLKTKHSWIRSIGRERSPYEYQANKSRERTTLTSKTGRQQHRSGADTHMQHAKTIPDLQIAAGLSLAAQHGCLALWWRKLSHQSKTSALHSSCPPATRPTHSLLRHSFRNLHFHPATSASYVSVTRRTSTN